MRSLNLPISVSWKCPRLTSGMFGRLAFAVATMSTRNLLVDEALSAGDAFQKKAVARVRGLCEGKNYYCGIHSSASFQKWQQKLFGFIEGKSNAGRCRNYHRAIFKFSVPSK